MCGIILWTAQIYLRIYLQLKGSWTPIKVWKEKAVLIDVINVTGCGKENNLNTRILSGMAQHILHICFGWNVTGKTG